MQGAVTGRQVSVLQRQILERRDVTGADYPTHAGDHSIKLSISYALSQSTKLCVYEERVLDIVQSTKDLPESLAETGECRSHAYMHLYHACPYELSAGSQEEIDFEKCSPRLQMQCLAFCAILSFYTAEYAASAGMNKA